MTLSSLKLKIETEINTPIQSNYTPPTWPPAPDFPVVIDRNGTVISRYGDVQWDISSWSGSTRKLTFNRTKKDGTKELSPANESLFKQTIAWWLWGPYGATKSNTIRAIFGLLKIIFKVSTENGILASELFRFPRIADMLAKQIKPSQGEQLIGKLNVMLHNSDGVGFLIADRQTLTRIASALPNHKRYQTPYIPPRIWMYQTSIIAEFLKDFIGHEENIKACFRYCIDAYIENYGSLDNFRAALSGAIDLPNKRRAPFTKATEEVPNARYHGPFSEIAKNFGIHEFLRKWTNQTKEINVRSLSACFRQVGILGNIQILNYSFMRIEEALDLRVGCLQIDEDEKFGPIYLLNGETQKTIEDSNALWITAPEVLPAIRAMTTVSRLKVEAIRAHNTHPYNNEELEYPHLLMRCYEPWASGQEEGWLPMTTRPKIISFAEAVKACPHIFDVNTLRITESDLEIAKLVTPVLDHSKFSLGSPWSFTYHQLRRTGTVNMAASGLVSDSSMQVQLKHASRAMSLYYGQGYSKLNLNSSARDEYVKTMYEMLGKQFVQLHSDRFQSPHGNNHKTNILKTITIDDAEKLESQAKAGRIFWRETLFGGCMYKGECEYGGIENVIHCCGGDGKPACSDLLIDKEKHKIIESLIQTINERLDSTVPGSPAWESLTAQKTSAENALYVIHNS
ncbi:TPA: hypothetical protein ACGJUB_003698 [Pseudomonas aeruginosa]|uniref:hypothetical protein n=1 Tax=Pseudomonas aeruginosa TaxID=287 RepID=UPI00053EFB7C|nr:hypothetical protein [Pseudomonas aeruginosa]